MADDFGDKTEAPTARRRQEAREQGQIARSPDLSAAVMMISALILLDWYGPGVMSALKLLMQRLLSSDFLADPSTRNLSATLMWAVAVIGKAMLPLGIGVVLVAVVVNLLQVGFFLNIKRIQPNIAALNPLKGLGRLFNKSQSLVQLGMNVVKMTLVGMVAWSAIGNRIEAIMMCQQLGFIQIFALGASLIYSIMMRVGVLLLILALLDYMYQRWRIEREMKMSKQEVKDEMRRMEGDPQIKQRRRQIARQMLIQKLQVDVPKADVVVTNPTHLAIALKYDSENMHAPRVVAKGQDYIALKIREIAAAHGVPILERKPLARALYKLCDVGQEIPERFYSVVAEILAYVYELTGKVRRKDAPVAA